jgi:hypothetical protein
MNPILAKRTIQKACAGPAGTSVTLHWVEYPVGAAFDPPSGTMDQAGIAKSCTTKAFVHEVRATVEVRMNAEIRAGDLIVDFALPLVRVGDPGDTTLTENSVVSLNVFTKANRTVTGDAAEGEEIDVAALPDARLEFNGEFYTQQPVGSTLSAKWDCVVGNVHITRTVVFRPEP